MLSTKNCASSSSGISADSRSRYWWLWLNHQILVDILWIYSWKSSVFLVILDIYLYYDLSPFRREALFSLTMSKIHSTTPIRINNKTRLVNMFSTRILTAKSSASWESQNTNWSNRSIGTVQKLHPVILLNTILINPPIVITGTRGTTKRLIRIPVRLVLPTKKSKIGKVPRLAPKVGNPYSFKSFSRNKSQTFWSFFLFEIRFSVETCCLRVYRSETARIPTSAPKLRRKPKS